MARMIATQNAVIGLFESGTYRNASGNFWIGLVQSHNVVPVEGIVSERYMGGNGRDIDLRFPTGKIFRGTIVYHPQDFRMLAWTAGSNVDAGSPSPYSHVISTINNDVGTAFTSGPMNPFLSFGIEESNVVPGTGNNWVRTIKGCMVNDFELTGEQNGGPLQVTVNYIGTSGAWSSGTPTSVNAFTYGTGTIGSITDRPYVFSDVQLSIPSGTVYNTLTGFTFRLSNGMLERWYMDGSRDAAAPIPNVRSIMTDLTFDAASETAKILYEQYWQGGSQFNMILSVNASAGSRDNVAILSGCRILDSFESALALQGPNPNTIHVESTYFGGTIADLLMRYNPW